MPSEIQDGGAALYKQYAQNAQREGRAVHVQREDMATSLTNAVQVCVHATSQGTIVWVAMLD